MPSHKCLSSYHDCMNQYIYSYYLYQDATSDAFIYFKVIFISLGFILYLIQLYFTKKSRVKNKSLTELYHFTSSESLGKIIAQKRINNMKGGRIFTTFDVNKKNIGTGKSKNKTPSIVIFRGQSLALFQSNKGMLPTGNKFFGSLFSEYVTKSKGDLLIKKSKSYLNVIVVSEACFIPEKGKRKFYLYYLSSLTTTYKLIIDLIYIFAFFGIMSFKFHMPLLERNWIVLMIITLIVISFTPRLGMFFKTKFWDR